MHPDVVPLFSDLAYQQYATTDHHAHADHPADGCKGFQLTTVSVTPDVGSHTAHLAGTLEGLIRKGQVRSRPPRASGLTIGREAGKLLDWHECEP